MNIGQVTDDGFYTLYHKGEMVAHVPVDSLAEDAPTYYREAKVPERIQKFTDSENIFQKLQTARSVKFSKNFWLNRQLLARNQFMKLMIRA